MQQSATLLWKVLVAIWFAIVLLSYWSYHPQYSVGLMRLPNTGLIMTLLTCVGAAWFWVDRRKPVLRGWMVYAFVLGLSMLTFAIYGSIHKVFTNSGLVHTVYFAGVTAYLHAIVLLLWLLHAALGSWVIRAYKDRYTYPVFMLISMAVGFSLTAPLLLVLGMAGMLKGWLLWIVFGAIGVWRYKEILILLRALFLSPLDLRGVSGIALVPVFLLCVGAAVQVVMTIKPWPVGFDGALLYANTANLIASSGGLPQVGQAFNWELLMSLGKLMFASTPVSILLSHTAIYLCMFALYHLARMFMGYMGSLASVSLLFLTPAFAFHSMLDEKVDLGFLFILLAVLLWLLGRDRSHGERRNGASKEVPSPTVGTVDLWSWGVAGWMMGYAFGIKYTALFAMLGLGVYMVYRALDTRAALGAVLMGYGGLFLLGVHNFGYLDLDGASPLLFAGGAMLPGIFLMGGGLLRSKGQLPVLLRQVAVYVFMVILAFTPWMIHHYNQNRELSLSSLVQGKVTPPALASTASLRELLDPALLPTRRLLQTFNAFGVTLSANQAQQLQIILRDYTFNDQNPVELQRSLISARNRAIQELLDPAQRTQVQERMDAMGLVMDDTISDVEGPMDKIVQTLQRRGVELDNSQKMQVRDLLLEFDLQGMQLRGSREDVARLRESVFTKVLTPAQYAQMQGLQTGELAMTGDGEIYQSPLFGGIQREEIRRYMGYEDGLPLYLSLPHDLTMNVNIPFSRYLDISFLVLLLLFILLLGNGSYRNLAVFLGVMLVWIISVYTLFVTNGPADPAGISEALQDRMGIHHDGISQLILPLFELMQKAFVHAGVAMHGVYKWMEGLPFLVVFFTMLLIGIGVFFALRVKLARLPLPLKHLLAFAFAVGAYWFFMGNAIVWYGFVFFAVLLLLISYYYEHPEKLGVEGAAGYSRKMWRGGVVGSMLLSLSLFFVSATQDQQNAQYIFQHIFLQHASSNQQLTETRANFLPYMDDVLNLLNADPSHRIYRVGTFFNYHIQGNDRRVLADNQLGLFDQVVRRLDDPQDFIQLLKLSGFRYILYDLNTGSIDKTPEKSLQKKAQAFMSLLITSPDLAPMYTDNFIRDPNVTQTRVDGFTIPGVPGLGDEVTRRGYFVLYEIK
jgi:hypothetical protein